MQTLKEYVETLSHSSDKRIQKFRFQERNYWLKQLEKRQGKLWFIKTRSAADSLKREIKALLTLQGKDIPVSPVVLYSATYMVLEDTGEPLNQYLLQETLSDKERLFVLTQAAQALAHLHTQGLCHGRPALRDITWDGEKIHFIDLENFPHKKITHKQCMYDLLIFIHALYRGRVSTLLSNTLIEKVILAYRQAGGEAIWQSARNLCRRHRWLYSLLWFARHRGGPNNDLRPIRKVFELFYKY